jgi:hypothetical protein
MNQLIIICWIILCAMGYIPAGVLLVLRSAKKPIRNRSPLLVSIAHWSNFLECSFLLLSFLFSSSVRDKYFDTFYQIVVIIVHYSFFLAYMLRCYRVYFIFSLDSRWDELDSFFQKNIHRAGQKWLLKVFLVLLWPVVLIAMMRILIAGAEQYFPPSYYEGETQVTETSEGVYLLVLFFEELAFILSVFKLRNVNDDFKMTAEMTTVCILWVVTGMFSIFPNTWAWRVEVLIRNHVIMLISSIYPLVKSMGPETFDEIITLEMLQSLELVLQSSITLNAFEKSLVNNLYRDYNGYDLLQLWLKCENYKHKEDKNLEKEIILAAKSMKLVQKYPSSIKLETFNLLNSHFFGNFKKSEEYKYLLHDVTRQQIYISRILQTSLSGNPNDIQVSMLNSD